jgi:hypothetical protein
MHALQIDPAARGTVRRTARRDLSVTIQWLRSLRSDDSRAEPRGQRTRTRRLDRHRRVIQLPGD